MAATDHPCVTQVDAATEAEWNGLLAQFADASIFQTWAYGSARWGQRSLSHLVLRVDGEPMAVAQVRIIRLPVLPWGIAYVARGPAWQPRNRPPDLERLRGALRALREEYAGRRGLALKVVPNLLGSEEHPARGIFVEEGFECHPSRFGPTILMDLSLSLQELRAGFRQKWRQYLNHAEKAGLDIREGTDLELHDAALRLYREMRQRKQFTEFVDQDQLRIMQERLPENARMRIVVGSKEGEPVAAIAWSVVGETGLPLLAATGRKALENDAAYLMWWKMLAWLKDHGYRFCDLGGLNPDRNPGSYQFKTGIGKRHGQECRWLGEFDYCQNPASRILVKLATSGRKGLTALKLRLERIRRPQPPEAREVGAGLAAGTVAPRPEPALAPDEPTPHARGAAATSKAGRASGRA